MKDKFKKIPILGFLAKSIYRVWKNQLKIFPGSMDYWKKRYETGGNSGAGSYNKLAEFKAEVLNDFVKNNNIETVIEFGCGDGNQLRLSEYPFYIGFDVSPVAISNCCHIFINDKTKVFKMMQDYNGERAQAAISIDVIYHLIEDNIFNNHMEVLFNSSDDFVIIYSSNTDNNKIGRDKHVKHRKFTEWIDKNQPQWKLVRHIPNRYPYSSDAEKGSFAEFFIYKKISIQK